jgi:hypothetical protein
LGLPPLQPGSERGLAVDCEYFQALAAALMQRPQAFKIAIQDLKVMLVGNVPGVPNPRFHDVGGV